MFLNCVCVYLYVCYSSASVTVNSEPLRDSVLYICVRSTHLQRVVVVTSIGGVCHCAGGPCSAGECRVQDFHWERLDRRRRRRQQVSACKYDDDDEDDDDD